MTRQELMEQMWKKDKHVTAGDIALALSSRFPKCQGNRTLADGTVTKSHFEMAGEFLAEKRKMPRELNDYAKKAIAFREFKKAAFAITDDFPDDLAKEFKQIAHGNLSWVWKELKL